MFFPSHSWLGEKHVNRRRPVFSNSEGIRENSFTLRYFPRLRKSREKPVLFLSEKGPSSAVENRLRFSTADAGSPPIPGPLRFLWNLRGRAFFRFTCFFPLPLRGRGNKIFRNRKERQDFFSSAPQGQRKKTRESEETTDFSGHRSLIGGPLLSKT